MGAADIMRAVIITRSGGPEVLQLKEVEAPAPGPGQIRVQVAAFALNRADLLQRLGRYPAPPDAPQDIPGLEYAGIVESVGAGVERWTPGDRVMGITGGGAYAEQLVVHAREALPVPADMALDAAAAIPEAFMTAWDAVHLQAGLKMGDTLLVHAVGSGVGTAAVQLGRMAGASVIGTSRTLWKLERSVELGLSAGVHAHRGNFLMALTEATGGAGVDVILDLVGAAYLAENLKSLASGGTMVTVGLVGGISAEINLALLLSGRLKLIGTVLRSRPLEAKMALAQAFARQIVPAFEAGLLAPVIGETFEVTEIAAAHQTMANNATFGKIVVVWP